MQRTLSRRGAASLGRSCLLLDLWAADALTCLVQASLLESEGTMEEACARTASYLAAGPILLSLC